MTYDPAKLPPPGPPSRTGFPRDWVVGSRGLNAISGAMALVVILLMVQIWLLTATLSSYLSNRHHAAVPGAIISGVIFLCCFGLYLFIEGIDRDVRKKS